MTQKIDEIFVEGCFICHYFVTSVGIECVLEKNICVSNAKVNFLKTISLPKLAI